MDRFAKKLERSFTVPRRIACLVLGALAAGSVGAGPVREWLRVHPNGVAVQARAATTDGQTFVALGDRGVILRTSLGATWQQVPRPGTNELHAGLFWNGQYVVVGDDGVILTSRDGVQWAATASGTRSKLVAVVSLGAQLLALGEAGTVLISANGSDWEPVPTPVTQTLRHAAAGGERYVVVGDGGTVLTSPDARTWTCADVATTNNLREVVFGNGLFLARGSKWVVTSPDAIHWQAQQPQGPDGDYRGGYAEWTLTGLAFGKGTFVLSGVGKVTPWFNVPPTNMPALLVSMNGRDWQNLGDELIRVTDINTSLGKTVFGNGVFVCLHSRGT